MVVLGKQNCKNEFLYELGGYLELVLQLDETNLLKTLQLLGRTGCELLEELKRNVFLAPDLSSCEE